MPYAVIANSPSAGFIAWTGVHIVYDGVDYPVANGSSNKRFIFWQKASGGVLQASDTYPGLSVDDAIVFLNKGGVPISVLNASSTDGDLVVPGTITSRSIATDTIEASNIKTDAIIARHILAGSVVAEKLSVQELSAISANLGTMTAGTFTLSATGYIRAGAVNFASGTGIWMGYDAGSYKFRAGAPGSSRMEWNGTAFNIYDPAGNLTISSGVVDYTKIPDRPTSLAGINNTEATKLAGIQTAATRNVNRGSWASAVVYATGDIVLDQGVSWTSLTNHTSSGTVRPPVYPTVSNTDWTILAVKGADGSNGLNGTRTAILDVYRWSAAAPTTFPAGTSTYTWATGQFTAPATLNSWSLTPPAPVTGQTLWIARQLFADSNTSATSTVTWSATTSLPETYAGTNGSNGTNGATGATGTNGTRTAFLELYQWAAAAPTTFPSGSSTYTWSSGSFTAPTLNGWSLTPGAAVPGQTLWATAVRFADLLTTTTSTVTWNSTSTYAVGGAGANGSNAKAAFLSASSQVFQISKTAVATPANLTLTAYGQNVTGSPTFSVTSGTAMLTGTGNTRDVTAASMITDSVTVQMTWDGQTDFITIVKVREGADGLSGITAIISNESHTLPASTEGVVSSYAGSGLTVQVYEGSTLLTASPSATASAFRLAPITVSPGAALTTGGLTYLANTITVSPHSGMSNSVDSAILTLPITVYRADGTAVSLTRSQTLTKSKSGATGAQGVPGINSLSAILSNESHTFPAATDGTVSSYANSGTEIRLYEGATELTYDGVGTAAGTWKVVTSTNNIAVGSLTDSGTFLTVGTHSSVGSAQDTALVNYTLSGKNAAGQTFSLLKQQTFTKSKSGTNGTNGTAGATGATGAAGPALTVRSNRPASFTALDGALEAAQADIVMSATVQGIASPSYVWSFAGLQSAPASSGAASQTITAAQFGTSKSAIVTCTVNGTFVDSVTIVRLEKSTAQAGATVGANRDNLNVGVSANFISNSGPYPETTQGFVHGFDDTGKVRSAIMPSYDPWRPVGQGGAYLTFDPVQSPAAGKVSDINNGEGPGGYIRYPVVAGQRYEASVYVSAHRCSADIRIIWLNAAGTAISENVGTAVNNTQSQGQLSNWSRSVVFASAPVNAATAAVYLRSTYAGLSNPFTFASMWYFGAALPAQTAASDWSDGQGANWSTNVVGATAVNGNITAAQNAANTAQGAANTANDALAQIASDNVLSKGEKPAVILEFSTISQEYPGIQTQANGLGVSTANFDAAVAALQTYLTNTIATWNTVTVDTTIDGPTFRQKFIDYYVRRQELLNAIALNTANRLRTRVNLVYNGGFENGMNGWIGNTGSLPITDSVWGRAAVVTAVTGTDVIASQIFPVQAGQTYTVTGDSLFLNATSGRVYLDIEWLGAAGIIGDSAQAPISASHDFSEGDSNRLAHAVAVIAPAGATGGRARFVWEEVVGLATIGVRQVKVERGGLPATPYTADATLPVLQNNANLAKQAADDANAAIANITSDGVLSKGEKGAVILEYNAISAEYPQIQSQGDALGLNASTARANFDAAVAALQVYIGSLSPAYTNTAADTLIDGAVFRQKFVDYYFNKQVMLNAIAAKAATLATWSSVSGTGRPEDNATVGANDANLRVGIGANLIPNSDLTLSSGGWSVGYQQNAGQSFDLVRDLAGDDWRPVGGHNIGLYRSANPTGSIDIKAAEIPAIANARYELSGRIASHRCSADLMVVFLNGAGAYAGEVHTPQGTRSAGGKNLRDWELQSTFFTVPGDVVSMYFAFRVYQIDAGQTDSYTWLTQPMLCRAGAGQTQPSAWSAANFVEQITPVNVSTYIASAAIGAAQIGSISLVGQGNFNVKTAASGQRIEMDSRFIKVFDVSGVKRVQLGDLTL
jgi:hypothetical protein